MYTIELNKDAKINEFTNLLLNILGGLEWKDLSEDEKQLCRDNGFEEFESNTEETKRIEKAHLLNPESKPPIHDMGQ